MQKPAIPSDEHTRIDTLRALNILDTSPEERFDRLTRLARRLFGVPIALVSLVDTNRQWFKSAAGLACSETPREVSFCGHAILQDDIFLIPDALRDERFHDNPLVTGDPGVRFYAGCPLTVPNGSKLGTLCLIDQKPREFDQDDMALLRDLARMAEQELAAVQLATMDELTMISNRRGFEALAQHALNVCRRLHKPTALLFFDLNLFKQINDRFGHAEGDRALCDFATLLKQVFRDSDVIGRLGGDEFAALLTDTGPAATTSALSRLDEALAAHNQLAQRGYELCYSVGATAFEAGRHPGVADMMRDADERMYAHKRAGRTAPTPPANAPAAASEPLPAAA